MAPAKGGTTPRCDMASPCSLDSVKVDTAPGEYKNLGDMVGPCSILGSQDIDKSLGIGPLATARRESCVVQPRSVQRSAERADTPEAAEKRNPLKKQRTIEHEIPKEKLMQTKTIRSKINQKELKHKQQHSECQFNQWKTSL